MDAAVIAKMRAAMYSTQEVARPGVVKFFQDHPAEAGEVFGALFDERNAGVPHSEAPLQRLIALKFAGRTASPEWRHRDALAAAYAFPPTCQRMMSLALGAVVHAEEPSERCEALPGCQNCCRIQFFDG